ncbi:MAG TPA: CBS domain-containing protein [Gemmataceae bacterium]|nr:CBS domain-containing protein [Gemmataceae bacterium]
MICPHCGNDNLPGSEECGRCGQDMTQLDRPMPLDAVERSLVEDPVGRVHPRAPVTVAPDTTVGEAIRLMLDGNIGALLVVDARGHLLGIFSERDLLTKIAGLRDDYAGRPVSEFMTRDPESVGPHHTLAFALHKMDCGGYRHVPVLAEGQPVAMISVRDMLRHITRLCREH